MAGRHVAGEGYSIAGLGVRGWGLEFASGSGSISHLFAAKIGFVLSKHMGRGCREASGGESERTTGAVHDSRVA